MPNRKWFGTKYVISPEIAILCTFYLILVRKVFANDDKKKYDFIMRKSEEDWGVYDKSHFKSFRNRKL